MDINNIDWRQSWMDFQRGRRVADNREYWNNRAHSFYSTAGTSPYAGEFIRLAAVQPGETVLDMGCGSGTLALPFARAGHEVYACDFSHVMLEILERAAAEEGLSDRIHTKLVSWNDDWDEAQMPVCDVAVASRSMAADDIVDAIEKLDAHARRRVCCTLGTHASPRIDMMLLKAIGRPDPGLPEFVYGMNILWKLGKLPELVNIEGHRQDLFETREAGIEKHIGILQCSPEEEERLRAYADEHMIQVETEDGPRWRFDHERSTNWAFISWNKNQGLNL